MSTFKEGDNVLFKAAGKVSRLDGVAGKWMPAVVRHVNGNNVHITKQYESIVPDGVVDIDNVEHS